MKIRTGLGTDSQDRMEEFKVEMTRRKAIERIRPQSWSGELNVNFSG